jgi:hypothetical protein
MARIPYPSFCGPTYSGRSIATACDRTINFYPELIETGTGKNQYQLVGTPGIKAIAETGKDEPIRGIGTTGSRRILVAGWDTLYELNGDYSFTSLGSIAPDEEWEGLGAVTFAYNGVTYCICSGGKGYILDGDTLTQTIDMDQVVYLDGYYVALQRENRRIRISGLYDGLSWNDLDYAEKESARDYVSQLVADHGELWILGEETSEVWYNSGNSDFPLERVPSGRLELGSYSRWSAAKLDNSLFWLGNDERGNRVVWRADGYSARRVSTHAVEYHLNLMMPQTDGASVTAATTTFAVGWAYQEEGHSFYCLMLPTAPQAWKNTPVEFTNPTMFCFDVATNMWHERAWWNPNLGRFEPQRQRCHAYIWDHHLVGDRENGRLYEQSLAYYDDAGDRIRRERTGIHLSNGMKQMFYRSFQLDMEVAVGLGAIDSSLYGPDKDGTEYEI